MANPTTNYGWPMPTSTDLVTDLPADFALFGQPVDTSLKALNPETTLGDIAYRSSTSNTNTRLGIGTTGQFLSVVAGVPAWAAGSTGKIIQVINATYGTETSNSSTTFAATGLTATITPTLNTSKVLIIVNQTGLQKGANNNFGYLRLMRTATSILAFESIYGRSIAQLNSVGGAGASYLDAPATTSATTYSTQFKSDDTNIVYVNANGSFSSITLMEIGA